METKNKIEGLLEKPLWQMTGEEYCQLTHYALSLSPNTGSSQASTVQKERSKMLPMDCMTGESTELIVAVAVEYRDNALV